MQSGNAPIDAVITWVDGEDPEHLKKRLHFAGTDTKGETPTGTSAVRFNQSDELRYCIRSIRNFAPWIGKIFIVTDNQTPACIDMDVAGTDGVRIVDHREIFAGYEDYLPTFNSLSITSMIWRIPDLSDRFIFFNDDVFLTAPAKQSEYFDGDKIVVRGVLTDHSTPKPRAIQHAVHRNAALMIDHDLTKVVRTRHCPFAMRRSNFEAIANRLGARYFENASQRFRSTGQFSASSLHIQHCLQTDRCRLVSPQSGYTIQMKNVPADPQEATAFVESVFKRASLKHLCINQFRQLQTRCPHLEDLLDKRCGPPLAYEIPAGA